MLRLLSRGRKAEATGEDEPKKYKKANLGDANKMYYNEELKMWVEKGKEAEARAELEKLKAPPPSVMTPASSSTSLAAAGESSASGPPPPAPSFSRNRSQRYLATPGLSFKSGPSSQGGPGTSSGPPSGTGLLLSSGPASGSGLMPGMAGVPGIPGVPGVPGAPAAPKMPGMPGGKPGFFMPTPTASEVASDAAGGDNSGTAGATSQLQSGLPMNALNIGAQPAFFMPGAPVTSSASGGASVGEVAAETGQAEVAAVAGQGESATTEVGQFAEHLTEAAYSGALEYSGSSASGQPPALAGSGNLSFANWQPLQPAKQQQQSLTGGPEHVEFLAGSHGGQRHSFEQPSEQLPYPGAQNNGNHHLYAPFSNGEHGYATASGTAHAGSDFQSEAVSQNSQHRSSACPSQPANDLQQPSTCTADRDDNAAEGGGYNWGDTGEQLTNEPPQQAFGQDQDPFGQPQDPFGMPSVPAQGTGADGGWQGAVAGETGEWGTGSGDWGGQDAAAGTSSLEGGETGACPVAEVADSTAPMTSAADTTGGYLTDDQYAEWAQQGWVWDYAANAWVYQPDNSYTQQSVAAGQDAAQQTYKQAYDHGAAQGYYGNQQQPAAEGDTSVSFGLLDSGSAAAEAPLAAADVQQQQQHQLQQQQIDEQLPVILGPVHPELPGIATMRSKDSDNLGQHSATKRQLTPGRASGRHQTMPGSAPLPAPAGSGSPSGVGFMSVPPARSVSMHAGGISSLLPQARSSHTSGGSPPRAESSALAVPLTAVAGDASMLTTVRPSSPYARPVSPLSRSNTGMSDTGSAVKGTAQGFPIPSPPTQVFGRPGMFIPGHQQQQEPTRLEAPAPWQPIGSVAGPGGGAVYVASQGQTEQQQAGAFGAPALMNGYVESIECSKEHSANGPCEPGPAITANGHMPWASSSAGQLLQQQHDSAVVHAASVAEAAGRVHPYDALVNRELKSINWKAQHFKQPGKLNKLLPHEQYEMEKAQKEEEEQKRAGGTNKKDAFWYRQMEYRQKLPKGTMKPSISEPTNMPSHFAAGRVPSPLDSNASQASYYTDLQQAQQQYQQQPYAAPRTPARATTAEAGYTETAHTPGEEITPTSKFVPQAAGAEDTSPLQQQAAGKHGQETGAAAAPNGGSWQSEQAYQYASSYHDNYAVGPEQQQQAWQAEGQYANQQQAYLQGHEQQGYTTQGFEQTYQHGYQQAVQEGQVVYGQEYGQPAEQSLQQQQHRAPEQHDVLQQQLPPPPQQQQHSWGSESEHCVPDHLSNSAHAGAALDGAGTWADSIQQQAHEHQSQQTDTAAAAAAWGSEAGIGTSDLASAGAHAAAGWSEHVADAVDASSGQHAQERVPRESSSGSNLHSQPSTATAAAAASKQIVSAALENIYQQHAEEEGEETAVTANDEADSGWDGFGGDGWEGADSTILAAVTAAPAAADGAAEVSDASHCQGTEAHTVAAETAADGELNDADAGAWEGVEELVLSAEAAAAADGDLYGQEDRAVAEQPTEILAAAAIDYPPQWLKMRARVAGAQLDGDMAGHRETFLQWGDFVFANLPDVASWHAEAAEQEATEEQLDDVFQKHGESNMKGDMMEGTFIQGGLDLESMMQMLQEMDMDETHDEAALLL